jgi:hypothetical protein
MVVVALPSDGAGSFLELLAEERKANALLDALAMKLNRKRG